MLHSLLIVSPISFIFFPFLIFKPMYILCPFPHHCLLPPSLSPSPSMGNRPPSGALPPSWIQHPARNNAPRCVCQKGTGLCFVLGGSRGGHSRFPPFRRWSQPGASSLDETPDLPLPAGDPLAAQRSKPRCSPLRHVEADHLAGPSLSPFHSKA